ncbi:EcoAI/FtnUII family type I restriction enzme subunit R [Limnoraphis robusta]|uniref:DEAD/DEAH box helicase family protein n=1 Tax=Limnoraphis robusta CCNP1315 TaxID=3110306 RepID=A0ABU5U5I2_9CYAN|nr:DEAD/DEAH box helicase family protein [Limnoraphis robusta]MEA5521413.1 DEAD/DEAH box helicase family protein [Limnoraphis robusta CCNP1315]MEA5544346.1 DEAD/DEAH box helicase family protein [Limnoraphis robusta CCNP1324]
MNEAETRAELIDPALREAGWGVVEASRIRMEMIAPGRLIGGGQRAASKYADYVLIYHNRKLAVIEAKKRELSYTEGVQQAKDYAERLQVRFAYSTNGDRIYEIDMYTGAERDVERYPSPEELWNATYSEDKEWRDRFTSVPFEDKSGTWEARYYQHNAITNVLEAIANGQQRILITLATGTGKTFIAFQLAWKLFQSRWNKSGKPTRRPRILFLADRNILANQAFTAFSPFRDDALVRIDPDSIKKKGKVLKNGSLFFTIFQTFMAGKDEEGNPAPNFGDYASDFFDFIVIDECHRGGAKDESTWRSILEYFSPAVQLGLTATPRRDVNADTYSYFGEPVYTYSLAEGIEDGYLTPFKVKQIQTTLDEYVYSEEDFVIAGTIDENQVYTESDFNRIIEMRPREAYRVQLFMESINPYDKTLVFCANQDHALMVRDLINQMKTIPDPNYCVRVTANDGKLGEQFLRTFQDNDKIIPTILTTSHKLSTGVDARNVRNIVLMRPINSMIEFKQIIGRGTRVFEGKDYFTIYDFVEAYEHFNDPEWDGEPQAPPEGINPGERRPRSEGTGNRTEPEENRNRFQKIQIKLADGKERMIQHTIETTYWSPDGKPLSATEFIERLYGELPELFKDEAELRSLWSRPDTRQSLLSGLAEKGYGEHELAAVSRIVDAENSDIFDVLTYIAYAKKPISRRERVLAHKNLIFSRYTGKQQEFLDFVLNQYIRGGVGELDRKKLPELLKLKYHSVNDAITELGDAKDISNIFSEFQQLLYINGQIA